MLKMEELFNSKNTEVNKLKESNKNLLLEVEDKEKAQRELITLSQEQNAQLEELKVNQLRKRSPLDELNASLSS